MDQEDGRGGHRKVLFLPDGQELLGNMTLGECEGFHSRKALLVALHKAGLRGDMRISRMPNPQERKRPVRVHEGQVLAFYDRNTDTWSTRKVLAVS